MGRRSWRTLRFGNGRSQNWKERSRDSYLETVRAENATPDSRGAIERPLLCCGEREISCLVRCGPLEMRCLGLGMTTFAQSQH